MRSEFLWKQPLFAVCVVCDSAPFYCLPNFDCPQQWMLFSLRPVKTTFLYKICIFPTLNDDSAMNWPALKKNPFSFFFFFFFCSSIGTDFCSKRPPRDQIAPISPTAGLCREPGGGKWSGAGARAVPLKQILFPFLHKWKYYFALFVPLFILF